MSKGLIEELINKKFKNSFLRVYKHLYKLNDMTLIILKGHLLVEEEINELLNICLDKNVLKKGNFDFF